MIIDRRTGSNELLEPLRRRGCPAEMGTLEFGDISFIGNGPDGCPVSCGIEFKKVPDALKCLTDGRFSGHQLPGLLNSYNQCWLMIEGKYRSDMHSGVLQLTGHRGWFHDACIGGRRFMYRDFNNWLTTLEIRGGIRVLRAWDRTEAIEIIANLHHWWTDKAYEEHRSHLAMHTERPVGVMAPSFRRRVAATLPGIGWEKSAAVADHFESVAQMVNAPNDEWRTIEGIGPKTADKIINALWGE